LVEEKEEEEEVEDDIEDAVLVGRLREMGEPARLFGEGHRQRLRRFRRLGMVMTRGPIPTTLELVEERDMKVDKVPPVEDKEARKWLYRQLASYFTMVLREWEDALSREEKRDTFASKAAFGAMVQSKENMTPVRCFPSFIAVFLSIYMEQSLTHRSCSANSKKPTSTKASSSRSSRSSRRPRSAATSTPMTAICASASARQRGLSESPWWASTSARRERSCMRAIRDM
jgi:hypothetical protein